MKPSVGRMTRVLTPRAKNPTPQEAARNVTIRVTRVISRWSGLGSSTTDWVRWAMAPISVVIPVAHTTAVPAPEAMLVPAKISSWRSRTGTRPGSSEVVGSLETNRDSPVRVLWSTRRVSAARSWLSAGT